MYYHIKTGVKNYSHMQLMGFVMLTVVLASSILFAYLSSRKPLKWNDNYCAMMQVSCK